MNKHTITKSTLLTLFCWNIGNPSIQRARKQAEWLRKRPENILVLTETKQSEGCAFIERYFQAYGYNVISPKPERKEYGVMIISKLHMETSSFSNSINYLKSRIASVKIYLSTREFEIIGAYVPSRNSSHEKIHRKKLFLNNLCKAFEINPFYDARIFCGDLNILEPNHAPHYSFFKDWEYNFYQNLSKYKLIDTFRHLSPKAQEYSWVGRTGEGYRYDHCFISSNLLPLLRECYYVHEPRKLKLSDHSGLKLLLIK